MRSHSTPARQARGLRTREALIAATQQVVRDVGVAGATTRAIAEAANVAEGTIYRHFPDKRSLLLAAVVERHAELVGAVAALPDRAGTDSVHDLLGGALRHLGSLRKDVLPIELAFLADRRGAPPRQVAGAVGFAPDRILAEYLTREQETGRVRQTLDANEVASVLLAALFGVALAADPDSFETSLSTAIDVLVAGITPEEDR